MNDMQIPEGLPALPVVDTVRDFTNGDVEVNTAVNGRSWVPVACGPRPRTALGHPIIAVAGYYGLVEDSIFYNGKMVSPTGFEIAGGMRQTQSWTKSVRVLLPTGLRGMNMADWLAEHKIERVKRPPIKNSPKKPAGKKGARKKRRKAVASSSSEEDEEMQPPLHSASEYSEYSLSLETDDLLSDQLWNFEATELLHPPAASSFPPPGLHEETMLYDPSFQLTLSQMSANNEDQEPIPSMLAEFRRDGKYDFLGDEVALVSENLKYSLHEFALTPENLDDCMAAFAEACTSLGNVEASSDVGNCSGSGSTQLHGACFPICLVPLFK